ncbi:MAG: hypothetical protein JXC32_18270 [Anaerolineae bacterium]|nr:hypothetical protein [Anaerolineae bacterium]
MTRRGSSRSRHRVRLESWERILFILGATVYIVGLFGGLRLLSMPAGTALILLAVGGGIQLLITLRLVL